MNKFLFATKSKDLADVTAERLCGDAMDYASYRSQRSAMIRSYGVFVRASMDVGSRLRDDMTRAPISSFSRQLHPMVLLTGLSMIDIYHDQPRSTLLQRTWPLRI
jgi:hypothetical protein